VSSPRASVRRFSPCTGENRLHDESKAPQHAKQFAVTEGLASRGEAKAPGRLLEQRVAEENAKYAAQRKAQVGSGERNERIRTYNFPQSRVTDHRIELTLYNLPFVIEGDLDPVLEPLMAHDLEARLAALNV